MATVGVYQVCLICVRNLKCVLAQSADHSLLVLRNEQVSKHLEVFVFSYVKLSRVSHLLKNFGE